MTGVVRNNTMLLAAMEGIRQSRGGTRMAWKSCRRSVILDREQRDNTSHPTTHGLCVSIAVRRCLTIATSAGLSASRHPRPRPTGARKAIRNARKHFPRAPCNRFGVDLEACDVLASPAARAELQILLRSLRSFAFFAFYFLSPTLDGENAPAPHRALIVRKASKTQRTRMRQC
jgi:hypothetical protein